MRILRVMPTIALLVALATPHGVSAQVSGTFTDLGTLGGTRTLPIGMNDLGDVVGQSWLANDVAALPFVWSGGVMQPLGLLSALGHTAGHARAINNLGQIVGISSPPGFASLFNSRAVRWDNRVITDLNTPATAAAGWVLLAAAFDINDAGQIVGFGFKAGNVQGAFLLDNGVVTDLGTLGGSQAVATGINNSGQVVGLADNASDESRAYSWTNGVMTDLGGLSGTNSFNVAHSINDFGEAAGAWTTSIGGDSTPMFWDAAGTPTPLPLLEPSGTAFSINNLRQIAGQSSTRAMLWEGDAAIDIETLIVPIVDLSIATAINNAGQVVGLTDSERGFLIQLPMRPSTIGALIGSVVTDAAVQNSLLAKLNAVTQGSAPMCNALGALRNEIEAQSGRKIPTDVATRLLDAIDVARASCP